MERSRQDCGRGMALQSGSEWKNMKKGDICEGIIEKVLYPNKGYISTEEGQVLVKNGIPGQKVRFQVSKKRSGHMEGRILSVVEKSPMETRPPQCGIFPECGGCMYQTMSYPSQLKMKEDQVYTLLKPFLERPGAVSCGDIQGDEGKTDGEKEAGITPPFPEAVWEGILGSPSEFAYRNKMEFSFGDAVKDGPLTLGLHKKGSSYDVLTASDCRLVHPDMNQILSCVLEYYSALGVPYYRKLRHTGYLRHLLLRRGTVSGEILVHVVTTSQEDCPTEPLVQKLLSLPLSGRIVGILHLINDSLSDTVQSDETRLLWGRDYFMENLLGLSFRISTFSFFQPNSGAAELLYSRVREYLGSTKDQIVFDLYSGTGTIAQLAASAAKEVIGVEIVEEAVEAARENARRNGLKNCRFIAGDVLKVLDDLTEKPDTIILDPPRDGIHPKALPKILSYGVKNIVYISCKATSLARDLPLFLQAGYRIKRACCIDQFCQTVHVETVCLLSNRKPDTKVRIDVDLEDYYRIKDAKKNQN